MILAVPHQNLIVPSWQGAPVCFPHLPTVTPTDTVHFMKSEDMELKRESESEQSRSGGPAPSPTSPSACVVCSSSQSCSQNRIVVCNHCEGGYHQHCHNPSISDDVVECGDVWRCCYCTAGCANPHQRTRAACLPSHPLSIAVMPTQVKRKHSTVPDGSAAKRAVVTSSSRQYTHRSKVSSSSDGESHGTPSEWEGSSHASDGCLSPANPEKPDAYQEHRPHEENQSARLSPSNFVLRAFKKTCEKPTTSASRETKKDCPNVSSKVEEKAVEIEQTDGQKDSDDDFVDVEGDDDSEASIAHAEAEESQAEGSARTRGNHQEKLSSKRDCQPADEAVSCASVSAGEATENTPKSDQASSAAPASFYTNWVVNATTEGEQAHTCQSGQSATSKRSTRKAYPSKAHVKQGKQFDAEPRPTHWPPAMFSQTISMPRFHDTTSSSVDRRPTFPPTEQCESSSHSSGRDSTTTHFDARNSSSDVGSRLCTPTAGCLASQSLMEREKRLQGRAGVEVKKESANISVGSSMQGKHYPFQDWVFSLAKQSQAAITHRQRPLTPPSPVVRSLHTKTPELDPSSTSLPKEAISSRHRRTDSTGSRKGGPSSARYRRDRLRSVDSATGEEASVNKALMSRLVSGFLSQPVTTPCTEASSASQACLAQVSQGTSASSPAPCFAIPSDFHTPISARRTAVAVPMASKPVSELIDSFCVQFNGVVARLSQRGVFSAHNV